MKRSKILSRMLSDEGYRPRIDEDGDVVFKAEGNRSTISIDARDKDYIRLAFGFLHDEGSSHERALAIANALNESYKAVKSTVNGAGGQGVTFSIEAFYTDPVHLAPFLSRCVAALKTVSDDYFRRLRSNGD